MGQKLYQYAVLYHPRPTKDQRDAGEETKSEIVIEPRLTLAKDSNVAAMAAARDIPDHYKDKLDLVEILVRPF